MVPVRGLIAAPKFQDFIANHRMIAIAATTITAHTTGVTRFDLPLRGESFAAWSNSPPIEASFGDRAACAKSIYRKTARTLSQSETFS
jgi:hypothetical protein